MKAQLFEVEGKLFVATEFVGKTHLRGHFLKDGQAVSSGPVEIKGMKLVEPLLIARKKVVDE